MRMICQKDRLKLSKVAAEMILEKARDIARRKKTINVALPGGRSVVDIYKEFAKSRDPIWRSICIYVVDERAVPLDSPESNYKLIWDTFASKLVKEGMLKKENLHPLIVEEESADKGAQKYYESLLQNGKGFDIVLLSSGEDGHIAALYPNHKALRASGYVFLDDSPKPPAQRITACKRLIQDAGAAFLLFIGPAKKEAYKSFIDEKIDFTACPAKIATGAKECFVFTDLITNS